MLMGRRFVMMIMISYDICTNHNHNNHNKSAFHQHNN